MTEISSDKLQSAYTTAAGIVSRFGRPYLPIFQRIHDEVKREKHELEMAILAAKIEHEK